MIERLAEALHKADFCDAETHCYRITGPRGQSAALIDALRSEGVYLVSAETLAVAVPHMTDGNPLPSGTRLGGHSYDDWAEWYRGAAAAILAALPEETP